MQMSAFNSVLSASNEYTYKSGSLYADVSFCLTHLVVTFCSQAYYCERPNSGGRHGGALGCQAPPVAAGAPPDENLQMELHASDLAPLCSV